MAPDELRRLQRRWHEHDELFVVNGNAGPSDGASVLVHRGPRPLVFTAPHAVDHFRHGRRKSNDARTGGLAIALAEHLDGSVVALRRGGREFGDPNADLDHPLKDEAASLVGPGVTLIDVHGMADREHEVLIGLGPAPTEAAHRLAARFVEAGGRRSVGVRLADHETGFNAKGPATITAWASGRGAVALQLEIARRLRSVMAPAERRAALLQTFVDVFADG